MSVNILISMLGMSKTVGKIVYRIASIESDIHSSLEEKVEVCFKIPGD
jgi:hypothetical protein